MSSGQSPSQPPPPQAARNAQSHPRRHPVPRRSTAGPLDTDDPLSVQVSPPKSPPRQSLIPERRPVSSPSKVEPRSTVPPITIVERPKKDFGFLLRRDNFHALDDNNVPPPFRESAFYPTHGQSIQELLSKGRLQAAATLAAAQLTTQEDVTDHATIFSLLFTRLTCLQLAGCHEVAAQESKVLQDLNAPFYIDPATSRHLVPWELRVLAVRLQAMGFNDWRRGIMGYYELAREARSEYRRAEPDAKSAWQERLQDLGIGVGNALLEMGDDEGAIRHLKTLGDLDSLASKTQLALVYLRAGDVAAAHRCVDGGAADDASPFASTRVVEALCKMADGEFRDAIADWQLLRNTPDIALDIAQIATQNLAVCFVFAGEIHQARDLLENQFNQGEAINRTMTFNLATIYELCSDKSVASKTELAARVAAREPASTGWEFANADFKL